MMKSKWVVLALTVSVAANLLLAGYLIGQQTRPAYGGDPTRLFPRWIGTLPEDRQAELRPVARDHLRAMRKPVRGMRQQHRALQDALAAEPFDPAALTQALTQMRENHQALQAASDQAFAAFAAQLTAAERRALLEDIRKPRRPPWRAPPPPQ